MLFIKGRIMFFTRRFGLSVCVFVCRCIVCVHVRLIVCVSVIKIVTIEMAGLSNTALHEAIDKT